MTKVSDKQNMRWQQEKMKRTGCVLWALSRMLDVDYGMLATWFSVANQDPRLHADIEAVLADHGYDLVPTTLDDKGKLRFVEAMFEDGSGEGHAWYVDEDERVWGLGPDPSVPCDSVAAEKFMRDQQLRIERVVLIVRSAVLADGLE
ncbi:MAG: hypothetical protein WAM98_00175 [Terriglobales bacterium]